jgi:hypothetical protein
VLYGERGPRYVRIVRHEGPMDAPHSRSVHVFIERSTGNILKAHGWKGPAKGPRGNIFADDPLAGVTAYGGAYRR